MSDALGTASWADPEEFAETNAFEPGKFWLGRSPLTGQPIGYRDDRHVCLVSGNRSGKGTTVIIPNLCLWEGSVVVVDPKGENATVTAARRGDGSPECNGMGQSVYVLDPFGVAQVNDECRACFNPLDVLDPSSSRAIDDAGRIADALVVMNPEAKDPFWDQSARTLVKGLLLHVLTDPRYEGRRNLVTVRQLIARGDFEGVRTLREEEGETDILPPQVLLWEGISSNLSMNGVIAGIGETMANMAANSPQQFESVLQVANRNTEFLDSPDMQQCVSRSDFELSELKTDPKGVSVFLSLPQRYMGEHFRWLRMMITLTINELEAVPGQPSSGHPVLVCMDEFAGLKRMESIENAVAQSAGFGVKLFFVLQSLEQLKSTYTGNWETFLANAGLKIFFGLDDQFTRKYVSDFIGETEVIRELSTVSTSESTQSSVSQGRTDSETWGQQTSHGYSFSDNWKAMPFFLKHTAGFFAAISGKRQATRNRNTGSSESSGGSSAHQETHGSTSGTTQSQGRNESLHKRALITPDEVGRYFGRIDSSDDPLYPGLGLTVLTGAVNAPVQRTNYYEDLRFFRQFSTHPDHPRVNRDLPVFFDRSLRFDSLGLSLDDVDGYVRTILSEEERVVGSVALDIAYHKRPIKSVLLIASVLAGFRRPERGRWNESRLIVTDRRLILLINNGKHVWGKPRDFLRVSRRDVFDVFSIPLCSIYAAQICESQMNAVLRCTFVEDPLENVLLKHEWGIRLEYLSPVFFTKSCNVRYLLTWMKNSVLGSSISRKNHFEDLGFVIGNPKCIQAVGELLRDHLAPDVVFLAHRDNHVYASINSAIRIP